MTIILFIPLISEAQLTAPGMSSVRYTLYPSSPGVKDPVFIYCNASGTQKGSLNVTSPGGTAPFSFSWFRWDDVSKTFTSFPGSTSSMTNLDEGGYKVRITDLGGYDTSLIGWIFIDKPFSSAELQNRTCDYVALRGGAAVDTFYYKDPLNGIPVKLPNGVRFLWSSTPSSTIPFPDLALNPQTFDPPLVDVTYKIQVSDSFGCISESSFLYESIHVKADFTVDPNKGEAPLEALFTDKSIRGTLKYTWDFGDKTRDGKKSPEWIVGKDSLWMFSNPFPHIYYKPGEYSVKLTVESVDHCIDSMRFEKIVVDDSKLEVPNVFTPDGDGLNDNFIVESKSLRYISVNIYSRSGIQVYSFSGDGEQLRNWEGWDGNVNKSSIKATPGVYFYLIHAFGWDDIEYNGKEYRGIVYLYR